MKLISFNVRGLGGWKKRRVFQRMVRERCSLVVCIQETELEVIDNSLCRYLWGSPELGYSFRPFVGAFEGLLTLWDINEVEVIISKSLRIFLLSKRAFSS